MSSTALHCTRCRALLGPGWGRNSALQTCPTCGSELQLEIFPAFFRPLARGRLGEAVTVEGEAACFYHPQSRAVVPCAACGRFLCSLCDVDFEDQHLCPACLEAGRRKGQLPQLEARRRLDDSAALSMALLPILLLPIWLFLAPLLMPFAIFYAIRSWSRPSSIIPRTRIRAYVALGLAVLQLAAWLFGVFYLAQHWPALSNG